MDKKGKKAFDIPSSSSISLVIVIYSLRFTALSLAPIHTGWKKFIGMSATVKEKLNFGSRFFQHWCTA